MTDKQVFLDNILANADARAESLIAAAKAEEAEALKDLEKELAESETQEREKTRLETELILSRRASAARIAASKIHLCAKQQAVDSAYKAAKQSILKMPDKAYFELMGALIAKHAQNGYAVVFAESDKKRVPKDFVNGLAAKLKIKLSVSDNTHKGNGGVILKSAQYDKNLSLDALLQSAREETETEVVKILFPS